jgi:CRP-like cAMP-binding protein
MSDVSPPNPGEGDLLAALRAHPFSRVLSEPQLERLFRCASVLTLVPGAFVFREGEPADRFFLIRSGQVALEQHVPGRGTLQTETLNDGGLLGFSWLFETGRWTLDARAVEASELCALDGDCVRRQMQADPALGLAIATQLIHQLYGRLERVRLQRLDVYRAGP